MTRSVRDIETEAQHLADLVRNELATLWAKAHGCPPPKAVRQELLVHSAAWHLQAKRLGGYSAETRRLLRTAIMEAGRKLAGRVMASRTAQPTEGKGGRIDIHPAYGVADVIADAVADGVGASDYTESAASASSAVAAPSKWPTASPLPSPATSSGPPISKSGTSLTAPLSDRLRRQRRKLHPGARLLRDWNGRTHVVDVIEGGYVFEARLYASLSAIAREITGTHWSGPRFFGL